MSGTPNPSMSLNTFLLSDSPLYIIPNTLWGTVCLSFCHIKYGQPNENLKVPPATPPPPKKKKKKKKNNTGTGEEKEV